VKIQSCRRFKGKHRESRCRNHSFNDAGQGICSLTGKPVNPASCGHSFEREFVSSLELLGEITQ